MGNLGSSNFDVALEKVAVRYWLMFRDGDAAEWASVANFLVGTYIYLDTLDTNGADHAASDALLLVQVAQGRCHMARADL